MAGGLNTRSLAWVVSVLAESGGILAESGLDDKNERTWSGASIDSRAECSGRIFFAMKGENTDGHLFAKDAFAAGCVAVIIEDKSLAHTLADEGVSYLLVNDCTKALQQLARAYRRRLDVRVVAITGSAGKTSTKEYVKEILKSKFRVFATPGNFNSLIGVPLTILETETENEYLVCEIGANQVGEVGFLSEMLSPDIGVITNIGDAHVGMFGSVENIVSAKGELLDNLGTTGCAVLLRDSAYFEILKKRSGVRTITFGLSTDSDFVVTNIETSQDGVVFAVNGEALSLGAFGEHNALNACAAYAVGDLCGVDPSRIRTALKEVSPMPGRGRVFRAGGVTLIDESYNASPASMVVSVATLDSLDAARRVAVLGDMKELGAFTQEKHEELGQQLAAKGVDRVFWLGDSGEAVRKGLEKGGRKIPLFLHTDVDTLVEQAVAETSPGDAVLVKGSRACNLDLFVSRYLDKIKASTEN